jgi:hypothetical protein
VRQEVDAVNPPAEQEAEVAGVGDGQRRGAYDERQGVTAPTPVGVRQDPDGEERTRDGGQAERGDGSGVVRGDVADDEPEHGGLLDPLGAGDPGATQEHERSRGGRDPVQNPAAAPWQADPGVLRRELQVERRGH